jgi:hypothetical protein
VAEVRIAEHLLECRFDAAILVTPATAIVGSGAPEENRGAAAFVGRISPP